jgi:hypothetical protein
VKKFYLLILLSLAVKTVNAQQPCGTYEYETHLGTQFPGFTEALNQTREVSLHSIQRLSKASNDTVYRIPVVFHIVWNINKQNIHDSLIHSQMKVLNEAFRHTHNDTNKVRSIFKPVAGDTKIEFYLATKDPNGNPTNGINRVKTSRVDFGEAGNLFAEGVKSSSGLGVEAWNTDKFLNIWVCNFTFNGSIFVAAYAFPPTNAKFWSGSSFTTDNLQGVVVNYQYVGIKNPNDLSPTSLREKTLPHEVGHFLGLRHIWADKRNTCFGEDDGFSDTPLSNSASTIVNFNKNTCKETTNDKPDMIENYMDYTPYPNTIMFTKQQADLMRFNLLNLRSDLAELIVTKPPIFNYPQISVYPNPVQGELKMNFEKEGAYKVILTDMTGRKVVENMFELNGKFEHSLSTSNMASGVYHLSLLLNNEQVYKQRLIVQ